MKVLHVSHADARGGAARAAYRIHTALRGAGADSHMLTRRRYTDDWTVDNGYRWLSSRVASRIRPLVETRLQGLQTTPNPIFHSSNLLPSRWSHIINGMHQDVVNLHWIGAGTMSIEDVGRISAPLVMTLHDMWAFCGAEHYAPDTPSSRWRVGYSRSNRPSGHRGVDLDRLTWLRKRRSWDPTYVVAPSIWLADCARESALMSSWPIHVIPYPLDVDVFRPLEKVPARELMGLPADRPVILFGALGDSPIKGFDLLLDALPYVASDFPDAVGVIFGHRQPQEVPDVGISLRWLGPLFDDVTLALAYSAADLMVVPSRQDNLPQTAVEAQSCGTPVVAFDTSGLSDAVEHQKTGYLAEPLSSEDLCAGIRWVLEDDQRSAFLAKSARERAVRLWSPSVVARRYLEVYSQVAEQTS